MTIKSYKSGFLNDSDNAIYIHSWGTNRKWFFH